MPSDARVRIWVVSELYYPEETSTGRFVTGIAEAFASNFEVHALCSQPTYFLWGTLAPKSEIRRDVSIERVWSTRLDKNSLMGKLLNMLTFTGSIFTRLVFSLKRDDLVLVVTNPPLLPYITAVASALTGARAVLLVHDVYPEVLTATGMMQRGALVERLLRRSSRWLYERMEKVVVIGRDMAGVVSKTAPAISSKVTMIPNWSDTKEITPAPRANSILLRRLNLQDRFVVQYFGNMGRTHGMEILAETAIELARAAPEAHLLFIGEGARRAALKDMLEKQRLTNWTLLPSCSPDELSDFLNSCDVAVITLLPGMAGVSVPSRMYNVLAAGKPIIAAVEDMSEVAYVVREHQVGWVVPPNDSASIVQAIIEARSMPAERARMSVRARAAAEDHYSAPRVHEQFHRLFAGLASKQR